jgi:hypothetical protein
VKVGERLNTTLSPTSVATPQGDNKMDTQRRKWFITINNPETHGFNREKIKKTLKNLTTITFWAMADEVGLETQTPHTHLVVYSDAPIRHSTMRKAFEDKADIEAVKSSVRDCLDYIKKEGKHAEPEGEKTSIDGTFESWGTPPPERQGKRSDMAKLVELVEDGASDSEIRFLFPSQYLMYKNHISRLRQCMKEEKVEAYKKDFRFVNVCYLYGKTGVGKSRHIAELYGYENAYRVTNYQHVWDLYDYQDIVVFEDFYGQIPLESMLNLLDGHPTSLPARYNPKTVACFTTVWFTSNDSFDELYKDVQRFNPQRYEAFARRVNNIYRMEVDGSMTEIKKSGCDSGEAVYAELSPDTWTPFDDNPQTSLNLPEAV